MVATSLVRRAERGPEGGGQVAVCVCERLGGWVRVGRRRQLASGTIAKRRRRPRRRQLTIVCKLALQRRRQVQLRLLCRPLLAGSMLQ